MEQSASILIVDDDEDILTAGSLLLKRHFEDVVTLRSPEKIPALLKKKSFDAILLDMNYEAHVTTGKEGLSWLSRILEIDPEAVVILITAYSSVGAAVEAMKRGAIDFVEKPWKNEKLIATLTAAINLRRTREEASKLRQKNRTLTQESAKPDQEIIGQSSALQKILKLAARAAPTDANVIITGENGTGKELIAREIHRLSNREDQAFMAVDLGALSENLFESELFGHKKGAFTDAREDRTGRFLAADKGTLFLDEIGNLPLHLQPKLLAVLEQRKITPVGSDGPISIDVRVISATNLPAVKMKDETVFRQDLLYRLNTVEIHVPPLRERKEDIPILVQTFAEQYSKKYHRPLIRVSPEAMQKLQNYNWPGNIRALRHAVERAVILAENKILEKGDFALDRTEEGPNPSTDGNSHGREKETLYDLEKSAVERALENHGNNISRAAKELGLTRTSLYRRMKKYGL